MEFNQKSKMDRFKEISVAVIIYVLCAVRKYWYLFLLGVITVILNIVGLVIWHHHDIMVTITLTATSACLYAIILIFTSCSCNHFSKTQKCNGYQNNDFSEEESGLIHETEKLTNLFFLSIIGIIVSTIGLITLGTALIVWIFTE